MNSIRRSLTLLAAVGLLMLSNSLINAQENFPVAGLYGTNAGEFVQLTWQAPDVEIQGYNVYYKLPFADGWTKLNDDPFPFTTFIDIRDTTSSSQFIYAVAAVLKDGSEAPLSDSIVVMGSTPKGHFEPKASSQSVFDKNNIISNTDLVNVSSMDRQAIQTFLSSHSSVLATYTEGGNTAAQIIFSAAQAYQINPQAILTMLQKEASLITMTVVPQGKTLSQVVNLAMGYNSTRTTFTRQVNDGTSLLRKAYNNIGSYGWAVNVPHSVSDGPRTVTPQNAATAVLYIYNPWIGVLGGGAAGVAGNSTFWYAWYNMFRFGSGVTPVLTAFYPSPNPPQAGKFDWAIVGNGIDPTTVQVVFSGPGCSPRCAVPGGDISYKDSTLLIGKATLSQGGYSVFIQNGGGAPSSTISFTVVPSVDLAKQARQDVINRASREPRFSVADFNSYGENLNWDPNWQLRWMTFSFSKNRRVTMYHATAKGDPSVRYVEFWDPDNNRWMGWDRAF